MNIESNGPGTTDPTDPAIVYANAPGIIAEICWLTEQMSKRTIGQTMSREFWLRKAAVMDRIAIKEAAEYAPEVAAEAVTTAELAAGQLIDFDAKHSPVSRKGLDLVDGDDCREYVREQYREWSCS